MSDPSTPVHRAADAAPQAPSWQRQDAPRLGWLRLRFADPALEHAFRLYHQQELLPRMQLAAVAALALFLAFGVLDLLTLPPPVLRAVLSLRLGIAVPALALAWVAMRVPRLHPWLQPIVASAALLSSLATVGMLWAARAHGHPMPYEGVVLCTLYAYFLAGLRFVPASACGAVVYAAYLAVELHTGGLGAALPFNAVFLGTLNVIGGFGCLTLEQAMRQNHLALHALRERAERDALTGLLNRRAFGERAEEAWRLAQREGRGLALAMIDVDHFKRYNDHYGHPAGDAALVAVAGVLASHAQRPLDLAARYGGEEFVVLWPGLERAQALALAERLHHGVAQRALAHAASPTAAHLSLSIGLCWLQPRAGMALAQALRAADAALYQAKAEGRNRVCAAPPSAEYAHAEIEHHDGG